MKPNITKALTVLIFVAGFLLKALGQVACIPTINITVNNFSDTLCAGTDVTFTASTTNAGNAAHYQWQVNGISFGSDTSAVTYAVVNDSNVITCALTAADSCDSGVVVGSNALTIWSFPNTLSVYLGNDTSICAGNGFIVWYPEVSGGAPVFYQWGTQDGGDYIEGQTVYPYTTSQYCVTVTDIKSCTASNCATVTVKPLPNAYAGHDSAICAGNEVELGNSPEYELASYNYLWSPAVSLLSANNVPNPLALPSASTRYSVMVTDTNGCSDTSSVLVTVYNNPSVAPSASPDTICSGQSISLEANATPGSAPITVYQWSSGLGDMRIIEFYPLLSTTYYLTVTDANYCSATGTASVTVNAAPGPVITGNPSNFTGCGSVSLDAGAGYSYYLWSTGQTTESIHISSTAIYSVTVSNGSCLGSSQQAVFAYQNPFIFPTATPSIICSGQSSTIAANATPGSANISTYNWNPSIGGNLPSGQVSPAITTTYYLTVTDANLCSASGSTTVAINSASPPPTISGNPATFSGCGSVSLTASGGYTQYLWSNGATTQTIVANISQTYTVTVNNGACPNSASQAVTVFTNPTVILSASPAIICNGQSSILAANASSGTPAYSYTWSAGLGNVASASVSPTSATTYYLTVTDALGCTATSSETINVYPNPIIDSFSSTPVSCYGSSTGSLCVYVSGGIYYTSYSWSNGSSQSACINNISAMEEYAVTVVDNNGCAVTGAGSVSQPPQLSAQVINADSGTVPDSVTVIIAGGIPPYSINWNDGQNTSGVNSTAMHIYTSANIYAATVTDANGCSITKQINVTCATVYPTISIITDSAICGGSVVNLHALVTNAGSTPVYQWRVNGFNFGPDTSAISIPGDGQADTITCILTSSLACANPPTITSPIFGIPTPVSIFVISYRDVFCNGGSDGFIDLEGEGGTAPYQYNWYPAGPSGLAAGTYTVTVTDTNACSVTASYSISQPAPLVIDSFSSTPVSCYDSSTGSLCVYVSGGTHPYFYAWSSGNPQLACVNNVSAGEYAVTVADHNSCTVTGVGSVSQPPQLTAEAGPNINLPACFDSATIGGTPTASGGQAPYTYNWGPDSTLNSDWVSNPTANPAITTQYTVVVTDSFGCTASGSVMVNVLPSITANAGTDTSICSGAEIILGGSPTASGGSGDYNYSWSPDSIGGVQVLSNPLVAHPVVANLLSNTTFTVTATDRVTGCSATDQVTVLLRPSPTANAGPPATVYACPLDSVTIGGSPTASGTAGPYTYAWTSVFDTSLSCRYCPNPEVPYLDSSASFCIQVTDVYGCQSAFSCVEVTVLPNTLFARAANGPLSLCTNGNPCVTLGGSPTVVGGVPPYIYQWFGAYLNNSMLPNPQACPIANTEYFLLATDSHGCQASDSTLVVVSNPPVVNIIGFNSNYCINAGNVNLTGVPPGGTFSGPGVVGNAFGPGLVGPGNWCITYTYTDANTGCSNDTTVCVTVNALPDVSYNVTPASRVCAGTSVTLSGTGAVSYMWSGGVNDGMAFVASNTDTYTVTGTDTNNCQSTVEALIIVNPLPDVSYNVAPASTVCAGTSVTLSGAGALFYIWSGGISNGAAFAANNTDTYTVTGTDANNCQNTAQAIITVNPKPDSIAANIQNVSCNGYNDGAASVNAFAGTAPYQYTWLPNINLDTLSAGTYYVTATDNNGCSVSASFSVSQPAPLVIDSFSSTEPLCYDSSNGSLCVHASGGASFSYSYTWTNGSHNSCINNLAAGIYEITIADINSCTVTGLGTVSQPAQLSVQTLTSDTNSLPDSVALIISGGVSPYTIVWGDGQNTNGADSISTHIYISANNYNETITDAAGCVITHLVDAECAHQCVWPGDANDDGIVNNLDLLPIGLAYDSTGYARLNATINWSPQYCESWIDSLQDSINYKYIDCNGDGIINANDTSAIIQNYSLIHLRGGNGSPPQPGAPPLYPDVLGDTVLNGDTLTVQLILGDSANAANNVYGIAFSLNYNISIVDTSKTTFTFGNSWLGTSANKISIAKDLKPVGEIDCALTRIDHTTKSGQGPIGAATFVITTDNINGKDYAYFTELFYISDVLMIDNAGNILPVNPGQGSTELGFLPTNIAPANSINRSIRIYPNPANNQLVVSSGEAPMEQIKILDVLGNELLGTTYNAANNVTLQKLDISNLTTGVYMVEILTVNGFVVRKLIIDR